MEEQMLFYVDDGDGGLYILATSFKNAVNKWSNFVLSYNGETPEELGISLNSVVKLCEPCDLVK